MAPSQEIAELKAAIDANDLPRVKALMTGNPDLHRAPMGYNGNGPLTWVAECRVPWEPPSETRLEMARWMIENGSDVHQGGDGPLMRAALMDYRIAMMELLVDYGAGINALWNGSYPIICAPCETLLRKQLRDMGDAEKEKMREFHDAPPIAYARQFQEPRWVSEPAIAAIRESGGTE